MAFKVTINTVTRSGQSVDMTVTYTDDATPTYSQMHQFNFHPVAFPDVASVQAEVKRVGVLYRNGLNLSATLAGQVGNTITVP